MGNKVVPMSIIPEKKPPPGYLESLKASFSPAKFLDIDDLGSDL
jgi:hypothetical protein